MQQLPDGNERKDDMISMQAAGGCGGFLVHARRELADEDEREL